MGNLCGQERLEQSSLMKSKLCISKIIGKAFVQILQGEILTESASAILNIAHDPYSSYFFKTQQTSLNTRPKLISGVPTITPFYQNGIQFVIHLKIPATFSVLDQEDQIQTIVDAFELANSKCLQTISFTEPPKDILQNQQKDLYAKVVLSAFQFYIFNSSDPKINLLKIINPDSNTTNIYMKELLQIAVTSTKQSYEVEPISKKKENQQNQKEEVIFQSTNINIEQQQQNEQTQEQLNNEQKQQEVELEQKNEEQNLIIKPIIIRTDHNEIQQNNTLIENQKNEEIVQCIQDNNQNENKIGGSEFEQKQIVDNYSKFLVSDILEKAIKNLEKIEKNIQDN